MTAPNRMWNPPKPAASRTFPQLAGQNSATAPSTIKQRPINGTTRMENAPPVTTPVPYSSNHTPAIAPIAPARTNISVNNPPAKSGGTKLYTNLRPGPERIEPPASRALENVVQIAIATATAASPIQVRSQPIEVSWREAITAAPIAVMPMATPPQPGTAVKEPARSMVSRMKRRLSRARSSIATRSGDCRCRDLDDTMPKE